MTFPHRHLLDLHALSPKDIQAIFSLARTFQADPAVAQNRLQGKTLLNLFCEPSTRTRISFEMAIKRLGGSVINMSVDTSSFKKGETLFDTIKNLESLGVDGLIIRHANGGAPHFVAQHVGVPVINAGDGFHEHPTQGLLDAYSLLKHFKTETLDGKSVLIWGDIAHSRVARSNIWALQKMGATVSVGGPLTLMPSHIETLGVEVVIDLDSAIGRFDAINVLRMQYERQALGAVPSATEYRTFFGLTAGRLQKAKPEVVILHPGPINRGIELDSGVADGPQNIILDQVENGVWIRAAVLSSLFGKENAHV
ncbi:MAG: aspartate carbamoyltransferase catalytic subunit [Candidatus Margulisiibacteriota bacterium]